MKKLLITVLSLVLTIMSCSKSEEKSEENTQLEEVNELVLEVSQNHNIASFNIYQNDKLAMQLTSSTQNTLSSYIVELDEFDQNQYTKLDIEPLFLDSTSADASVDMKIYSNGNLLVSGSNKSVKYGEVATISLGK